MSSVFVQGRSGRVIHNQARLVRQAHMVKGKDIYLKKIQKVERKVRIGVLGSPCICQPHTIKINCHSYSHGTEMDFISFHMNMTCGDIMFIYIELKQKSSYMC